MTVFDALRIPEGLCRSGCWLGWLALLSALALAARLLKGVRSRRPPVLDALPVVGGLIKFLRGPLQLVREGYSLHGEVFTVGVLHKKVTILVGPNVTGHLFKGPDRVMSQREVYKFIVPAFGKGVVYDVHADVMREQISMVKDGFRPQRLREYVPRFQTEVEGFLEGLPATGEMDLGERMADLVTKTTCMALLGKEVRETEVFEAVKHLLRASDNGMHPISIVFPYLPIAAHRKRDAAREKLTDAFRKLLSSRRASGRREEDLLQSLMDGRYQKNFDGRGLTDSEIAGLLIASLFAGQHTSSITAAWTGYQLVHNREWWDKAIEEQKRVLNEHEDSLGYDALNDMPVLTNCIHETLRINPPIIMILRQNHETFTVTTRHGVEYDIPAGHILATSPNFTHKLPHLYKNPAVFDPDRFNAPRVEHSKNPFSYISFGGGRHMCMGMQYALLQIKVIWSMILRNYHMEALDAFPRPNYSTMIVGPLPCRIFFERRANPLN